MGLKLIFMDPHFILDKDRDEAGSDGLGSHADSKSDMPFSPDGSRPWPDAGAAPENGQGEMRFPAEDGGRSLAEMAQRDLAATLQLLTERAQYITGATGAAIALRDSEEMVCRASAGGSAPEVGAQLQVNSGLSGESVRTRQTLRCDDALTDERVNRESCEALGIRSVVVMPLLQGDDVIGVFELFSDKPSVFEARDITALERMGSMVHTALEQSAAATGVEFENPREIAPHVNAGVVAADDASAISAEADTREAECESSAAIAKESGEGIQVAEAGVAATPPARIEELASTQLGPSTGIVFHKRVPAPALAAPAPPAPVAPPVASAEEAPKDKVADGAAVEGAAEMPAKELAPQEVMAAAFPEDAKRKEGKALAASSELESDEVDVLEIPDIATTKVGQDTAVEDVLGERIDHAEPVNATTAAPEKAPPVAEPTRPEGDASRGAVAQLSKCQACGFPVSEGRQLCLDCEKKGMKLAKESEPAAPSSVAAGSTFVTSGGAADERSIEMPAFLGSEEEEASWIATHKLMVIAMAIAVVVIVVLMLAR